MQVGILQGAKSGNAPTTSEMNTSLKPATQQGTSASPAAVVLAARWLSSELGYIQMWSEREAHMHFELAPVAFLAGYLARVCEEKVLFSIYWLARC